MNVVVCSELRRLSDAITQYRIEKSHPICRRLSSWEKIEAGELVSFLGGQTKVIEGKEREGNADLLYLQNSNKQISTGSLLLHANLPHIENTFSAFSEQTYERILALVRNVEK